MVYEDYLAKTDEAIKKYEVYLDNEIYHEIMDDLIVEFLRDMGYTEMADKYEKAKHYFWYA